MVKIVTLVTKNHRIHVSSSTLSNTARSGFASMVQPERSEGQAALGQRSGHASPREKSSG